MTQIATPVDYYRAVAYTPGSDVAAGDVVVAGSLVGVAELAIASGATGDLTVEGVFVVPKANPDNTLTLGVACYWDATNHVATTTSSGNKLMGKVVKAAANTDTTVRVRLQN